MKESHFVRSLKKLRFAPGRGNKSYPVPLRMRDSIDRSNLLCYQLAYSGLKVNGYINALRAALRDDVMDLDGVSIEGHPSFKALHANLPPHSGCEMERGDVVMVHYERIGVVRYKHSGKSAGEHDFAAIAHLQHVVRLAVGFEVGPYSDGEPPVLTYQVQILDAWYDHHHVSVEREELVNAVEQRVRDHCVLFDNAIMDQNDADDIDPMESGTLKVVVLVGFLDEFSDAAEIAGMVATRIAAEAGRHGGPWDSGFEHVLLASTSGVKRASEGESKDIREALVRGTAFAQPERSPRAAPAAVHYLVEIDDKRLGLDPDGTVFATYTRQGEVEDGRRQADDSLRYDDRDEPVPAKPVRWRLLIDDGTGALYAEPLFGDPGEKDLAAFLERGWSRKDNLLFEGPPQQIVMPASYLKKSSSLGSYLANRHILSRQPESGFKSGIAVARTWMSDTSGVMHKRTRATRDELRQWCIAHQVVLFGRGWFMSEGPVRDAFMSAGKRFGDWCLDYHQGHVTMDTQAYLRAVGRGDGLAVLEREWPRTAARRTR
jgi:hypothetical protein